MAKFDCAIWKPINTNQGGRMSAQLGLILHHAVMNGSLHAFFSNPASEVSSQFWVSKSGVIEQYVDSETVAWHGKSLNSRYNGVETEGCTASSNYSEPMPPTMVDALARLYKEGAARHGWKNALSNADGQPGFGYHRMAVATACPCDVRLNQRPTILSKAFGSGPIPGPAPGPSPAPPVGNAPPFPGTLLRDFTEGHGTATWQQQMVNRGWALTVDNMYGNQSARACTNFQAEKGLTVDGVVGPETWNATWNLPIT